MVMDIRSLAPGLVKTDLSKTEKSKKKSSASSASVEESDDDSVSLTGQASQISQLIQQMKSAPVLDPDRVSPVKEKLDKGEYEIEYQQVANKMLDFESSYQGY
jgi:flagellar biosynthesis anti-sigma factor FlgM